MAPLGEVAKMLYGQAFQSPHMPNINLSGKTIIVTGANTGLGLACAKHLARKKAAHIILACRSVSKGTTAREAIYKETNCEKHTSIEVWPVDFTSYASVLSFGARARTYLPRLDALIANASLELQDYRTAETLETHLTVNVVSTILCAIAVLPTLRETSQTHNLDTTLTLCGSMYHIFGPDAELDAGLRDDVNMFDALSTPAPRTTDIVWRYALSKLMLHQCFHALATTLRNATTHDYSRVVVNLVNPGWCATELSRAKPHPIGEWLAFALLGWSAEKGSRV